MTTLANELDDLRQRLGADRDGLLTKTRARLTRLARARGVPPDMVDDVAQETLMEAWTHLNRLTTPSGFSLWIDEICRNVCRRAAQRRGREIARLAPISLSFALMERDDGGEEMSTPLAERLSDASNDPQHDLIEALSHQDLVALLDKALAALPAETRKLVEMCHLMDLPHSEVAARMGIASGALDTRLSRARRSLHRALSGPLRDEAVVFGLAFDESDTAGWQETRLWCPLCAQFRLQGCFVQFDDPAQGPNLHLRCPACARRYGQDTVHSMGLISLVGMRSFRPAWKRTMQGLTGEMTQALEYGQHPCLNCGAIALVQVADGDDRGADDVSPYPLWIRTRCVQCGKDSNASGDYPSVDQLVYWSHPLTRTFLLNHARWRSEFGALVEHNGAPAIPFTISDPESADQLTVLAHRHSLRVLALF